MRANMRTHRVSDPHDPALNGHHATALVLLPHGDDVISRTGDEKDANECALVSSLAVKNHRAAPSDYHE